MDQHRPPPRPVIGGPSSTYTSSSSVPSTTSSTDDQAKAPFNTSPSGRLTFVFPSHNPRARSLQRNSHETPPAELPNGEGLPSPTSSSGGGKGILLVSGRSTKGPLRLITDDALTDMLGPATNRAIASNAPDNVEEWVASSKQTMLSSNRRPEEAGF